MNKGLRQPLQFPLLFRKLGLVGIETLRNKGLTLDRCEGKRYLEF